MRCARCGRENSVGASYCQHCGAQGSGTLRPSAQGDLRCPRCGAEVPQGVRFCGSCGFALESREAQEQARVVFIEKDGSDGARHTISLEKVDIGRSAGEIVLDKDPYLSDRHVRIERKDGVFFIKDLDSFNGVYARINDPVELQSGDTLLIGQQLMRFMTLGEEEIPLGPAAFQGVLVFGTPEVPRVAALIQQTTEGVGRDVHYLYREETVLGRESGDIVFTDDPFLSRRHAAITVNRSQKRFILHDLTSSNGTYVRVRGQRELKPGDHIRIGRHLFRFELEGKPS